MDAAVERRAWTPAADIYEYPEGFIMCLELAGVQADDLEVLIQDRMVLLRGNRRLPVPAGMTPHRVEVVRGAFERRIRLPAALDAERSRTQLTDGLLLIHTPKRVPPRRIRVEAS